DVGANALTVEWFFRGVIFSMLWRRWSFWPAAVVSTGLSLLRYLLDPALPQTAELIAGAMFYMLLLGLASCALRAWQGSLPQVYLATVPLFAADRIRLVRSGRPSGWWRSSPFSCERSASSRCRRSRTSTSSPCSGPRSPAAPWAASSPGWWRDSSSRSASFRS